MSPAAPSSCRAVVDLERVLMSRLAPGDLPQQLRQRLSHAAWLMAMGGVAVVRRLFDVVVSAALLLALAPLLTARLVVLRLQSRDPALLIETRVGRGGRLFGLYRLRALTPLPAAAAATGGPSLGQWPQLLNVLKGEMSLLGPRPPSPGEVAGYELLDRGGLAQLPGLSGSWFGRRSAVVPSQLLPDGAAMPAPPERLSCFKAYDLRGRVPDDLDPALARAVGRAFVASLGARRVAVGHDIRPSSPELSAALIEGLNAQGADVVDIGQCGTEMIYFAAQHWEAEGLDGAIIVTASHNPSDHNGMKLVRRGARPVSADSGLKEIEALVRRGTFSDAERRGSVSSRSILEPYLDHLLGYVELSACRPLRIVTNAGNGCAGPVVEALARRLPYQIIPLNHEPDGSFPHGVPNPLLPQNRAPTTEAVRRHGADLGLAWDGDFDRCFFFDETGAFVEGYYIVGLLAEELLGRHPGEKILYEPRLTWNTLERVEAAGGVAVLGRTGHAFIKERMRAEDALYGGEMSAHHYFRDFAYCDSGMIPWLLVCQLISRSGRTLGQLVDVARQRYPVSGEINTEIADPQRALEQIRGVYEPGASALDTTDGLAFEFPRWRFNVRLSNTEPVVRLNVETRADPELLRQKTDELLVLLRELA